MLQRSCQNNCRQKKELKRKNLYDSLSDDQILIIKYITIFTKKVLTVAKTKKEYKDLLVSQLFKTKSIAKTVNKKIVICKPKKSNPKRSNQNPISIAKTRITSFLKKRKLKSKKISGKLIAERIGGKAEIKVA